jgi:hypothetical protein
VLRVVGAVLCGAALATGAAAFAAPPVAEAQDSASVVVSNAHAGARPVALAVSLRTELQCGRLRGGTLALIFPAAVRLPPAIAASTVAVDGVRPRSVKLVQRTLTITMPLPTGVMCNVIGPGTVKILVSRGALIGNPMSAGTYDLGVRYRAETLQAKLKITA